MPATTQVIVLTAISGVSSLVLTGAVRAYAVRHDVIDRPNIRSSHVTPTPRGAGLAVIVASMCGMALAVALGAANTRDVLTLAVGMLALGAVGWMDDKRRLRAPVRLLVHFAVAAWTLYMFGGLPAIRVGTASLVLGPAGYVLGAVGIVWSINLFNFMDGIDGLAGSQAVLIFAFASILLFSSGDGSLGAIAAILSAASAGFLAWNWPPAKIFLGDVGSGAIGYLIAALTIGSENRHAVPLLAFAIAGGVFIADASVTVVRRLMRGNRPAEAHRDHAYQRLARAWGSHRPVSLAAAGITTLLAALAAVGTLRPALMIPALVAAFVVLMSLLLAAERRAPM
jgi:Fuc2NAc and GlcNAc transferase